MRGKVRIFGTLALIVVVCLGAYVAWIWSKQPRMLPYESPTANVAPADTDWPQYGNTPGGVRFAALDQINRSNVDRLKLVWSYQTGELAGVLGGKEPFNPWEATPILVSGTLIGCSPVGRVFALDPATGKPRWTFDPKVRVSELGHAYVKCRGLSSFEDSTRASGEACRIRVIYGTEDFASDRP